MRKGFIQALKFIVFLALGVLLLWIAFRNVNFKVLAEGLKKADYSWIVLSCFFGLIAYISRARRWELLIHPLGYKPSLWHTFHALMTGYLANVALPRIGEITRCAALGKKENIPVDQLFGTVIIERSIDFISLLSIMVIMVLTSGEKIKQFLKESIFIPLQQKVFSLLNFNWIIWLIIFSLIVSVLFLILYHRKKLRRIRFFSKMFDVVKGIINGLKSFKNLKRKWEFLFHTILIWVCYALMTWVVVFAIDSTSHLTIIDAVFLLVIGGLAMSAPVQSGLGAFHYIVSRGLAFVEGVNLEDGLIYAILTHESQLIFVALTGTISFIIMFRHHLEKSG